MSLNAKQSSARILNPVLAGASPASDANASVVYEIGCQFFTLENRVRLPVEVPISNGDRVVVAALRLVTASVRERNPPVSPFHSAIGVIVTRPVYTG